MFCAIAQEHRPGLFAGCLYATPRDDAHRRRSSVPINRHHRVLRTPMAGGGHIRRTSCPSRRGNTTPMVRQSNSAYNTSSLRALQSGLPVGQRCIQTRNTATWRNMVPKNQPYIHRCNRDRAPCTLGRRHLSILRAKDRTHRNSAEQAQTYGTGALLRRIIAQSRAYPA